MNGTKLGVNGHFCIKNVIFCIIYITNIPYFGTKIDVECKFLQEKIFQGCLTHFFRCATIHGKAMKETIVYAVTLRQGEAFRVYCHSRLHLLCAYDILTRISLVLRIYL